MSDLQSSSWTEFSAELSEREASLERRSRLLELRALELEEQRQEIEEELAFIRRARTMMTGGALPPTPAPKPAAAESPTAAVEAPVSAEAEVEEGATDVVAAEPESAPEPEPAPSIHDMTIADAAIELARRKGAPEASAGEVHHWFEEEGFETRSGIPSRTTVYQALNTAANDDDSAIGRGSRRGQFALGAAETQPVARSGKLKLDGLGIVDAAIAVAKHRGTTALTAPNVVNWLDNAGYTTRRGGKASRASVYTALHNAANAGTIGRSEKRGEFLIEADGATAAEPTKSSAASAPAPAPKKTSSGSLDGLSIVDAAIELARRKGLNKATASHVAEWLTEAGFKTDRSGRQPSYGTVYSALTAEVRKAEQGGTARVARSDDRGYFVLAAGGSGRKGRRQALDTDEVLEAAGAALAARKRSSASAAEIAAWLNEAGFGGGTSVDERAVRLTLARASGDGRVRMDDGDQFEFPKN